MKKLLKYITVPLLSALFLVTACVKDDTDTSIMTGPADPGEDIEFRFTYMTGMLDTDISTRAIISDLIWNKIEAVDVFVYETRSGNDTLLYHRRGFNIQSSSDGSVGSFSVRLAKGEAGEQFRMDFMFNVAGNGNNYVNNPNISLGMPREEVLPLVNRTATTLTLSSSSNIPMWAGLTAEINHSSTFNTLVPIRIGARVDIGTGIDEYGVAHPIPNFTLLGLAHQYSTTTFYLIPADATIQNGKVVTPSYNTHYYGQSTKYTPHNSSISLGSVSPATDCAVRGQSYIADSDPDHYQSNPNLTQCIVFNGNYTDPATNTTARYYYAIRLRDENGNRLPLLRNTHTTINIRSVNGPGAATAISAAQSDRTELMVEYEINVQNMTDEYDEINHIVYDATDMLGVDKITHEKAGVLGYSGYIRVLSTHSSGWSISSVKDINGTTPDWISLTPATGSSGSVETITYTMTKANDGSDSGDGQPRTAYVTLKSGTLTIEVQIVQNGTWSIETDWDGSMIRGDGDDYNVYVWGAVPNLQVRAYSPTHDLVVSWGDDYMQFPAGVVNSWTPLEGELPVIGNAVVPNVIRQVQFQYLNLDVPGSDWVTFQSGPQGKGHYRLRSSGRIVSLYDYQNGNTDKFSWTEGMGIDPRWNQYYNNNTTEYYYQTFSISYPTIQSPYPLQTGNNVNSLFYTPEPGFMTGCADYVESGYESEYPKGQWRLPAVQELYEMYLYNEHIGDLASYDEGYWSSTDQRALATYPGSYRVHIYPDENAEIGDLITGTRVNEWFSVTARSQSPTEPNYSRIRCVFGDPVVEVLEEDYVNWYYNPNNPVPGGL